MSDLDFLNKLHWDVDRHKSQFNPRYWDLVRRFVTAHKTKYPEKRVMELTHAFYQMVAKRKKFDWKTTRMVSALAVELLEDDKINYKDNVFNSEDNSQINNPKFTWKTGDQEKNGSTGQTKYDLSGSEISTQNHDKSSHSPKMSLGDIKDEHRKDNRCTDVREGESVVTKELTCSNKNHQKESLLCENPSHTNIAVAVLRQKELKELLDGFVIFRGIDKLTKLNGSVKTLEESFRCSKFGPCEWQCSELDENCRIMWMALRWKKTILAEAVGTVKDELCSRIAKVVLSKIAEFAFFVEVCIKFLTQFSSGSYSHR
ncbi:hypothetical protein J6590_079992 [Homalodisca vitripennis]|nr:hypothetical protein J6590_079992 [Homalodisca vitripennis]